jgi:hypothetical protein
MVGATPSANCVKSAVPPSVEARLAEQSELSPSIEGDIEPRTSSDDDEPLDLSERLDTFKESALDYIDQARGRFATRKSWSASELAFRRDIGIKLSSSEAQCVKDYDRLYARDQIEIRVALGYFNFADEGQRYVSDTGNQAALIEFLLRPCPSENGSDEDLSACGFKREGSGNALVRSIDGPDGRPHTVRILVQSSSLSGSDAMNRGEGRAWQTLKTTMTQSLFLEGLAHSDVVIYAGHSRDGGGPSFGPPQRVMDRPEEMCDFDSCPKHARHVDYTWYHHHRFGEQLMLDALEQASPENRPKLLVLASCFSDVHFGSKIRKAAPGMGFLGTRSTIAQTYIVGMVFSTIDGLLRQSCHDDLVSPLQNPSVHYSNGERMDGAPRLTGFL